MARGLQPQSPTGVIEPGIRPVTNEDVRAVVRNLREADRAEVRALTGAPPELVVPACVDASRAVWTIAGYGGEPAGLWGLQDVQDHPEVGWVWMILTPTVERHPYLFLEKCRENLPLLHSFHPIVTNHVDERNTVHLRWLRWMGFSFLRRIERWGAEGRPFIEFARLNPSCASDQSGPYSEPR